MYELNMIGRHVILHGLLLNIDHNMIQPYKYLMYKILSLFAKFNAFVKLIHKIVYKIYYVSDIPEYTVYECIKHKI